MEGTMKKLILLIWMFSLVSQSFASEQLLSSDFLESDSVSYWILETDGN